MFVTHVKHFNLKIHLHDMDNIICESVCEGLRHTEHPGQKLHTSVRNNKSVTLQSERKEKKRNFLQTLHGLQKLRASTPKGAN